MKRIYTLQDLRKLGVETVAREALIGKGKNRRGFKADAGGVVFDLEHMPSQEQLKVGALLAALEKRVIGESVATSAPADPDTGEVVAAPTKKASAKKAPVKKAAPKAPADTGTS